MASIVLEPPSSDQMKAIREGLGMSTTDIVQRDVTALRHWFFSQPHLPADTGLDDAWLERYLIFCKNSVERAKRGLELYYTARGAIPEILCDRDPLRPEFQQSMDVLYAMPLPRLTPEGYRIHLYAHADPDPSKFSSLEFMRRTLMMADVRLREDVCKGDIIIFDLKNSRLAHLTKYNPVMLRKFLVCTQNAFPIRVAQVHFVNVPPFMDKIVALLRPLVKEKLRNRFRIHSDGVSSLLDYVPRSVLPKEYGGELASLNQLNEAWRMKLVSCREWLMAKELLTVDESKRPAASKKWQEDLFGCPGSFRQIAID